MPDHMYVVSPWSEFEPQVYRTADYLAYYRLVKSRLEASLDGATAIDTYPDPKPHCEICRWQSHCDDRRRQDDHPRLVAGISKLQLNELQKSRLCDETVVLLIRLACDRDLEAVEIVWQVENEVGDLALSEIPSRQSEFLEVAFRRAVERRTINAVAKRRNQPLPLCHAIMSRRSQRRARAVAH